MRRSDHARSIDVNSAQSSCSRTRQDARKHDQESEDNGYICLDQQGKGNEEVGREPGNYSAGHISHYDCCTLCMQYTGQTHGGKILTVLPIGSLLTLQYDLLDTCIIPSYIKV